MSLKHTIAAAFLASTTVTGAHAQKVPEMVKTTANLAARVCEDGSQIWSAKDGFIGCKDGLPPGKPEVRNITTSSLLGEGIPNSRETGEKAYREPPIRERQDELLNTFGTIGGANTTPPPVRFQGGGAELTAGVLAQEKYGTGFKGQLVFSGDRCGIVLDGHLSPKDRALLVGAGCTFDVTQDGKIIAILGYATRGTDAAAALGNPTFGGNLTGHQVDTHIGYVMPRAKIEFDYQKGQAGDTLLKDVTSSTATPYILDFADRTEQWDSIKTTRTITTADGIEWRRGSGTVTVSVGPNSEVFVTGGKSNIGHVSSDIWKGGFNTNIGDSALSVSGGQVDNHTAFDARFIAPAGDKGLGLGIFAGTMNGNNYAGLMVGYQFGATGKYHVPHFGGDLSRNTTIGGELAKFGKNLENHVPDLSTVVKITTRVEEDQKNVLKKTTPKLNTPLIIGGVTCTTTSYTVGGSTTCSITPIDPQGISGVSATIDGTPVTVNNASGTYTAVLSGLAVGTHPLIWSVVGKNPDGTAEAGQTATQTITVSSVAITPLTPKNETVTTAYNTPAVVNLLANDSTPNAGGVLALVGTPTVTNGTLTVSGGTVTVTPTAGFVGNMVVNYVVGDGKAPNITETATITVSPATITPLTPKNETVTTAYNTPAVVNLLANDSTPNAGGVLALVGTPTVTNGTLTVSGGTVTVTPTAGFVGNMVVNYVVGDGKAPNITETATITVSPATITPLTPKNETVTTAYNTPAVVNLLANDSTPNAGGVLALVGTPTVTNGTLTVSGGTVTVTPTAGFVGNMVVNYVVGDGKAPNITETATITVSPATITPLTPKNETVTTAYNTPAVVNLLANDSTPNAGGALALVGTPTVTNGTLTVSGGTVTVTPTAGFVGNMVVNYVVGDGKAPNITETATITVSPATITPLTPKNETVTTAYNTPAVVNLLANDSTPNAGGALALVGTPTVTNGTLTVSGGTVTVTPTAGFVGNMVVNYVVGDGKAPNITETATITVQPFIIPTLPATLGDMLTGDLGGVFPIQIAINMPALLDASNNQIPYIVSGLPTIDGQGEPVTWTITQTGSTINISGIYSQGGISGIGRTTIPLTITSPNGIGSTAVNIIIQAM